MEWVVCPQCRQPAEVTMRMRNGGTAGPVEHVHVQCLLRHWFLLPAEMVTLWPVSVPAPTPAYPDQWLLRCDES